MDQSNNNFMQLLCMDYGFDCDFLSESDDPENVVKNFGVHMSEEHGIDYSKGALVQILVRKYPNKRINIKQDENGYY